MRQIFLALLLFLSSSLFGVNNFVLFTERKTGTHLLIPILEALTGKRVYWAKEFAIQTPERDFNPAYLEIPHFYNFSLGKAPWDWTTMQKVWQTTEQRGSFLHLHAPYSLAMERYLAEKKCINFFVKRDPRDQIVSLINHYRQIQPNHALAHIPSDDERLLHLIQNWLRIETIAFKGWLQSPVCCVLDFRKLMGSSVGAATDQDALNELKKITRALSIHTSNQRLLALYKEHFGKGWSFHRGKVGAWKDYFKEHHKLAAKEEIGDLLIELGFEENYEW